MSLQMNHTFLINPAFSQRSSATLFLQLLLYVRPPEEVYTFIQEAVETSPSLCCLWPFINHRWFRNAQIKVLFTLKIALETLVFSVNWGEQTRKRCVCMETL